MTSPVYCPSCGKSYMGTISLVQVCSIIDGVTEDGEIECTGDTNIDWSTEVRNGVPVKKRYVCLSCGASCSKRQLLKGNVCERK